MALFRVGGSWQGSAVGRKHRTRPESPHPPQYPEPILCPSSLSPHLGQGWWHRVVAGSGPAAHHPAQGRSNGPACHWLRGSPHGYLGGQVPRRTQASAAHRHGLAGGRPGCTGRCLLRPVAGCGGQGQWAKVQNQGMLYTLAPHNESRGAPSPGHVLDVMGCPLGSVAHI